MKKKVIITIIMLFIGVFLFMPEVFGFILPVNTVSGEVIEIEVESSDTIEAVKGKITYQENISEDKQILFFGDTELKEGRTLADYNIQNVNSIDLKLKIKVTHTLSNMSMILNNVIENEINVITNTKDFNAQLIPDTNYNLPDTISIIIGEKELSSEQYNYDLTTGNITILKNLLVDDIEIIAYGSKICKVVFDANEGVFTNQKNTITYEDWHYSYYDNLEKPVKDGYKFEGYYTEIEGGTSLESILNESGIDSDMTFYAQWTKLSELKLFEYSENQEFIIGSEQKLYFILDNERAEGKVYINDEELIQENGNYDWHYLEGTYPSIILSEDYMKSLNEGTYNIKFVLDDGRSVDTIFTVAQKKIDTNEDKSEQGASGLENNEENTNLSNPPTGDTIVLYIIILVISIIGIVFITKIKKGLENN